MALSLSLTMLCLVAFLHIHAQESSVPNGVPFLMNTSDINMNSLMNLTTGHIHSLLTASPPSVGTTPGPTSANDGQASTPKVPESSKVGQSSMKEESTSQSWQSSSSTVESTPPQEKSTSQSESESTTEFSSESTESQTQQDMIYSNVTSTMMGENVLNSTYPTYSGYDDVHSLNGKRFSCYGRAFGQYADVSKDCHIFHLCYPFVNVTTGNLIYQRISFLCDADSVFDQRRFVCVDNSSLSFGCDESPSFYQDSNMVYLKKLLVDITGKQSGDNTIDGDTRPSQLEPQRHDNPAFPWNIFN